MAAPLTEAAIDRIRHSISSGVWGPGDRLPPEGELSSQLGVSRSGTREAVRALVAAKVLDVRRGDGTFVTSLAPELLLDGIGVAVELMQEDAILQLVEARRVIEPQVTALAAERASGPQVAEIREHFRRMQSATDLQSLVQHDSDFHASVAQASGNATLTALLVGISSRTIRARVWRGLLEADAQQRTIAEHATICAAIEAQDPAVAAAAALLHVNTTEAWVRKMAVAQHGNGETPRQQRSTPDSQEPMTSRS